MFVKVTTQARSVSLAMFAIKVTPESRQDSEQVPWFSVVDMHMSTPTESYLCRQTKHVHISMLNVQFSCINKSILPVNFLAYIERESICANAQDLCMWSASVMCVCVHACICAHIIYIIWWYGVVYIWYGIELRPLMGHLTQFWQGDHLLTKTTFGRSPERSAWAVLTVYTYVTMHIFTCMHTHTCMHSWTTSHVCMHAPVHTRVHAHMNIYTYIYTIHI
jgi:hypothetical protein